MLFRCNDKDKVLKLSSTRSTKSWKNTCVLLSVRLKPEIKLNKMNETLNDNTIIRSRKTCVAHKTWYVTEFLLILHLQR